jgi:hypothetical protein
MGTEYRHGFAVADLSWIQKNEKDFSWVEAKVDEVLQKWNLAEACVERRDKDKRLCALAKDGSIGSWKEKKQDFQSSAPDILREERRIDWKPAVENEQAIQEIAGRDFQYNHMEKKPELQWIHWQFGPNYKVLCDSYGEYERTDEKPFQCTNCGTTLEERSDPWIPRMLDGHEICPAVCKCGSSVAAASIKLRSRIRGAHAPDIAVWKSCLFLDFGKCHPAKVIWAGRMQSNDFVSDLEAAFGQTLVQFGDWY